MVTCSAPRGGARGGPPNRAKVGIWASLVHSGSLGQAGHSRRKTLCFTHVNNGQLSELCPVCSIVGIVRIGGTTVLPPVDLKSGWRSLEKRHFAGAEQWDKVRISRTSRTDSTVDYR